LLNFYFNIFVIYTENYFKKEYKEKVGFSEIVLVLGFIGSTIYPFLFACAILITPEEHLFLTELLIRWEIYNFFTAFPVVMLHIWYTYCGFTACITVIAAIVLVSPIVQILYNEIRSVIYLICLIVGVNLILGCVI